MELADHQGIKLTRQEMIDRIDSYYMVEEARHELLKRKYGITGSLSQPHKKVELMSDAELKKELQRLSNSG